MSPRQKKLPPLVEARSATNVQSLSSPTLELQKAVREGLERKPGTSFEVGGLLLGHSGDSVHVEAVRPLPIEHRFGPSFWLSSVDVTQWKEAIVQIGESGPPYVIGHFRSQRIEESALDEADARDVDHAIADLLNIDDPVLLLIPLTGANLGESLIYRRINGIWTQRQSDSVRDPVQRPIPVLPAPPVAAVPAAPAPVRARPRTLGVIGLAAAAILLLVLLLWRPFSLTGSGPGQIGLAAHATTGGISVRWNRESSLVRQSTSGVLTIHDGESRQQLKLTRDQLLDGSAVYVPRTGQVDFRLEVYRDSDHYTGESLSVMTGIPATAPAQASPQAAPAGGPQPPMRNSTRVVSAATRPAQGDSTRLSVPVTVAPPQPVQSEVTIPPAPQVSPQSAWNAKAPEALQGISATLPAPPPVKTPARAPDPAPITFVAPVPVRRVSPTVPDSMRPMLQSVMAQGKTSIDVNLQIDASGNVVGATPVGKLTVAQKLLAPRAIQAARLWHFDPARRNGQPVASEFVLNFVFNRP